MVYIQKNGELLSNDGNLIKKNLKIFLTKIKYKQTQTITNNHKRENNKQLLSRQFLTNTN